MSRRRNGPGAFLVSLGSVVLFSGLLVLLAYPAAVKMDRKQSEQEEAPLGEARQKDVVKLAGYVTATGTVLLTTGIVLLRRRPRH